MIFTDFVWITTGFSVNLKVLAKEYGDTIRAQLSFWTHLPFYYSFVVYAFLSLFWRILTVNVPKSSQEHKNRIFDFPLGTAYKDLRI